ncbi:peptidoglycan-binding domain-containing protein [Streptomyces morookaense]|uniref:peptidoglycan-binding domain-containing protein n=1 Tax=Streptomyces morookaense TaxID=1970 RepID=UPI00227D7BB2|nr:peptidoglycan-binding domain-containing protein [Streptomyces morookaense]
MRAFQRAHHMQVDGKVGTRTWAALRGHQPAHGTSRGARRTSRAPRICRRASPSRPRQPRPHQIDHLLVRQPQRPCVHHQMPHPLDEPGAAP